VLNREGGNPPGGGTDRELGNRCVLWRTRHALFVYSAFNQRLPINASDDGSIQTDPLCLSERYKLSAMSLYFLFINPTSPHNIHKNTYPDRHFGRHLPSSASKHQFI